MSPATSPAKSDVEHSTAHGWGRYVREVPGDRHGHYYPKPPHVHPYTTGNFSLKSSKLANRISEDPVVVHDRARYSVRKAVTKKFRGDLGRRLLGFPSVTGIGCSFVSLPKAFLQTDYAFYSAGTGSTAWIRLPRDPGGITDSSLAIYRQVRGAVGSDQVL